MPQSKDFDRFADGILRQFWKSHRSRAPEHVYHYTSAEGLYGILESNAVWAADCRFLNDTSESQVGVAKARDISRSRRFSTRDQHLVSFYRQLSTFMRRESPEPNFIFSLSERDDDLTQWRTYANDGLGFTIGFSSEKLLENSQDNEGEFEFSKVLYGSREQDAILRELFNTFENEVGEMCASGSPSASDIEDLAMLLD